MIRALLLLMLGAAAIFGIQPVMAQVNNYCNANQGNNCDEGQAYSVCMSNLDWYASQFPNDTFTNKRCEKSGSNFNGYFTRNGSPGSFGQTYFASLCSARPAKGQGSWSLVGSSGNSCHNGCTFGIGGGGIAVTVGSKTYADTTGATPTGSVCSGQFGEGQAVTQDDCQTLGTLTQCVTAQGKHCAVASSGKKFCWNPGETGTKVSGNEAATKSPQGATVNDPPVAPKNNGSWTQTGQGSVSTTSGGTTNNYSVTNHSSSYGPQGQGGGAEGEGSGDEGDGDDEGGEPGEGLGDFYDGTDKTIDSVMSNFYGAVTATQFIGSVTSFMSASGGGSCPTFSLAASDWWDAQTFDAHCSGTFLTLLQAMGWVVFALACYVAVKIAVT